MSDEPFPAARQILKSLTAEFARLEQKLVEGHALAARDDDLRAARAAEKAAHEKSLADLTARQAAEHEARLREISRRESELVHGASTPLISRPLGLFMTFGFVQAKCQLRPFSGK